MSETPQLSPHQSDRIFQATTIVVEFLFSHPYTAYTLPEGGRYYSDEFRDFVVGMTAPGGPCDNMTLHEIFKVTGVAEETLKEWQ